MTDVFQAVSSTFAAIEPFTTMTSSLFTAVENLDTEPHRMGLRVATTVATYLGRTPSQRMPPLDDMHSLMDLYCGYSVYPMRLDLAFLALCTVSLAPLSRNPYKRRIIRFTGIALCLTLVFPQQVLCLIHLAAAKCCGSGDIRPKHPGEILFVQTVKNCVSSIPNFTRMDPQPEPKYTWAIAVILGCGVAGALFFNTRV